MGTVPLPLCVSGQRKKKLSIRQKGEGEQVCVTPTVYQKNGGESENQGKKRFRLLIRVLEGNGLPSQEGNLTNNREKGERAQNHCTCRRNHGKERKGNLLKEKDECRRRETKEQSGGEIKRTTGAYGIERCVEWGRGEERGEVQVGKI